MHRLASLDRLFAGIAMAVAAALPVHAAPSHAPANAVSFWNDQLLEAIRVTNLSPPAATRQMALLNVAMFDAVNATTGLHYRPYGYDGPAVSAHGAAGANPALADAAADAAGQTVMAALHPARVSGDTGGIGQKIAHDLLAARADDGANLRLPAYLGRDAPGSWRPTPPGMEPGVLPHWPGVAPWVLNSLLPFRPPGPPARDSAAWRDDWQITATFGSAGSKARNADQTEAALFWADGDGTAGPPGHWISIGRDAARARGLDLLQTTRLLALLSLVEADAALVGWDSKYHYAAWRPVTAIRANDNPLWTPLLKTPAFPEYVSGHSIFSAAAAEMLCLFFNSDTMAFSVVSDAKELPGAVRQFRSFSEAATEAGMSRIWAGLHFPFSDRDGQIAGREVADVMFAQALLPVGQAPHAAACQR